MGMIPIRGRSAKRSVVTFFTDATPISIIDSSRITGESNSGSIPYVGLVASRRRLVFVALLMSSVSSFAFAPP